MVVSRLLQRESNRQATFSCGPQVEARQSDSLDSFLLTTTRLSHMEDGMQSRRNTPVLRKSSFQYNLIGGVASVEQAGGRLEPVAPSVPFVLPLASLLP